tara:strand:- start:3332 stop:3571 length:240 start_codon:yes stop_codon:yes gene_type:complete
MESSQIYILISIVVILVIAVVLFFVRRDKIKRKLTPLAGLAFGFILAGILFGDNRLVGYSLMGVGVLIAIVDMIRRLGK